MTGPNADAEWVIDAANTGYLRGITTFAGVEDLHGGNAGDLFSLQVTDSTTGSISGLLDGGGGEDALVAPLTTVNNWAIDGSDAGSLSYGTLTAGFTSVEFLTGGSTDDTFSISAGGSITGGVDGGAEDGLTAPTDTLDFTAYGSPISIDCPSPCPTWGSSSQACRNRSSQTINVRS